MINFRSYLFTSKIINLSTELNDIKETELKYITQLLVLF